jgi:glyoxylase-like metal-dependent hydrolase (beta-lactamase superfamily II)
MPAMTQVSQHLATAVRICLLTTLVFVGSELVSAQPAAQQGCSGEALAVQVLGSGGPFATTNRASTSYLVWQGGRAVVMVDVGGGAFLRFGEAGARLEDLSLLAISHLHPDHVSDLPALLWLSEIGRKTPLKLSGPSGGGPFPDIVTFVRRLFDPTTGAFPVLAGTLGERETAFA